MKAAWSRRLGACLLVLAGLAVSTDLARAHRTGEGYVYLIATEEGIRGRVEATLGDLNKAVPMDDDGDGEVTAEEFERHYAEVEDYVAKRVAVGTDGEDYQLQFVGHDTLKLKWGIFALLEFVAVGVESPPEVIEAEYWLLFDAIPGHRGLFLIERNDLTGLEANESNWSAVFSPEEPRQEVDLTEDVIAHGFFSYLKHGVWHILIGTDHVLFILALLMTSVLVRDGAGWAPVAEFRPAFWNVVKVITLFTVAHSVTLSAAALGWFDLSPRVVESMIALSVLVAALNNIRPFFGDWTWGVIFSFGLFHGLGFASVLTHLTFELRTLAFSLLGFNVGVELGQLAIILVAFPICYALRKQPLYVKGVLPVGSALIAVAAAVWCYERAFGLG